MTGKHTRLLARCSLRKSYDVVIIGGGVHGLAAAYFLAKDHNLKSIAVIERNYVGFGGSGRNTTIVRANQRTKENIPLYNEGLKLWPELVRDLNFNMMFVQCGNLDLAHCEETLNSLRVNVLTDQFLGIENQIIDAKECKEIVPQLDISSQARWPILGGMYHPPGGTLRHDAVVWGLARAASRLGVHIHQRTKVTGIRTKQGRVSMVETDRGDIKTQKVLNAAGGYSPLVSALLGLKMPIHVLPLQAIVSEPVKPFLKTVLSSIDYDFFSNQTIRGEIVCGSDMDHWPSYSTSTTARYLRHQAQIMTEVMPCLKNIKFMRQWAGLTDMTPDMAPVLEGNAPVKGYFMDVGWGYFGFKSGPIAGRYMAEYVATDECPDILVPFRLNRFKQHCFIGETTRPIYYGPWN